MRPFQMDRARLKRRLFPPALAAALALAGAIGLRASQPATRPADERAVEALHKQAIDELYGQRAASLTAAEKCAWRDRLLAAVNVPPATRREAVILSDVARLASEKETGDDQLALKLWDCLLNSPVATPSMRMTAADHLRLKGISSADSALALRAMDAYLAAAREYENDPDRTQPYSLARDHRAPGFGLERAAALFYDAQRRAPDDPQRAILARRAIEHFDECLAPDSPAARPGHWFRSPRGLLQYKGCALALAGDYEGVIDVARRMNTMPPVNPRNHAESVGELLNRAAEIFAGTLDERDTSGVWVRKVRRFLARHEDLVPADDPGYVTFQMRVAYHYLDGPKVEAFKRIEALLYSPDPRIRNFLADHSEAWANLLFFYGDCLMSLQRPDEARAVFEDLLRRFPDDQMAPATRSRLEKGW